MLIWGGSGGGSCAVAGVLLLCSSGCSDQLPLLPPGRLASGVCCRLPVEWAAGTLIHLFVVLGSRAVPAIGNPVSCILVHIRLAEGRM